MSPDVRPARPRDLEALVRLRLENAHVHSLLDPEVYRVPDVEQVRAHFAGRLAEDDPTSAVLVAVARDDVVLGSAEVAVDDEPPAHQVLRPVPSAHVHVVVGEGSRGLGLGTLLLQAAEAWAIGRGVRHLVAGIHADNESGLRLYGARGYRDNAVIRVRDLPGPPGGR